MVKLKGIEGLPFKFMLTLMVAAIIMAAFFVVLNQFSSTALAMTHGSESAARDILNNSLAHALK